MREKYEQWFRASYGQEPMPRTSPAHDFCWAGYKAGAASRDAEVAELVAALEDNWNCNPCETTRQQKAFDAAQSILAKVRKP